ncbi:MAG: methyltransferase [Candidatus Aegiribacteria sp.]|nr:methyltransferase [Candidatus Aegiribacteria sp.]MBD3294385.1 methyltransferase [Candidatus Fermentibacteria bacterium]
MIRIGRGKWKGHILRPTRNLCRPTSSFLRAAALDIAGKEIIRSRQIWDLCSGTGAVGLEALSWGAESCVFVDRNPAALAFTRAFLKERSAEDLGVTIRDDLRRYINRASRMADMIFLDPPYSAKDLYDWIDGTNWGSCVREGGVVFAEAGTETEMSGDWRKRKYGSSVLYWKWIGR